MELRVERKIMFNVSSIYAILMAELNNEEEKQEKDWLQHLHCAADENGNRPCDNGEWCDICYNDGYVHENEEYVAQLRAVTQALKKLSCPLSNDVCKRIVAVLTK